MTLNIPKSTKIYNHTVSVALAGYTSWQDAKLNIRMILLRSEYLFINHINNNYKMYISPIVTHTRDVC